MAATSATSLRAQVTALGKGHTYFVNNGLQVWGLDQGAAVFNYSNMANANFNGVMWSWGQADKVSQLQAGQKWGKWTPHEYTDIFGNTHAADPGSALNATENSKKSDLLALQVGDEQQPDLENPNGHTKTWFQNAHAGNYFPNQLLYVNSFYIGSDAAYANFIAQANPDAISFDSYPIDEPYGSVILPHNWLALAGNFRRHALSSHLTFNGNPIGNNAPRPYGLYLQTYAAPEGPGRATRHPGDVEMRWQQFTAWTMGFSFVDAFTVGGSSSLFNNSNQNDISQPRYDQFKESARQGLNLGPALTKLISHGYGPSIVVGRDAAGNPNPIPSDWLPFARTNAPAAQQHLTGLTARSLSYKNGSDPNNPDGANGFYGYAGDVYVGFFNPLHASLGDTTDTYFMVTNALGAYLNDPTATVADTQQQITLNFDTQYSGVSTLQRLRRSDGQLEIVPLTRTTARLYQLQFTLEGGTGDLFKYNDGSPFVGFNNALHWDGDGAGPGAGGTGTWDGSSNRWHNGTAHGPWTSGRDAVFAGSAGTVTLAAPQSVNSVSFKTNGYTLAGSTLTMAGQTIATDAGVSATIGSNVGGTGGIIKAGPGTLTLTNAGNTYSGGTTVTGGVLRIGADGAMGPAPAAFTPANIILNGGTLRFAADFNLANTRGIDLGPAGGTIDTQGFSNPAGYNAFQGGFRGPGDLTKLGSGTFFAAATTGGANNSWKGRLILKEGTWKIVASDGLPYNVPPADGLKADQVTLDGGTWQVGATMNITNARRGITVAAGGGTIDTQGFTLTWAGPMAGTTTTSTLTKTGGGTLRFTGVGAASTYNGNVHVAAGTLRLDNGKTMGDLASISLANAAGATLNVTGNETIGSISGGGSLGGNVIVAAGATLTTGANNASTNFAGLVSGPGGLGKSGSGAFTARSIKIGGTLAVDGGTVEIAPNGAPSGMVEASAISVAPGRALDMNDNDMIVNYPLGGPSPEFALRNKVLLARDGNVEGIFFTETPEQDTILAFGEASELGITDFNGVTVDATTIVGKYTYYGDANFDGRVTTDDYVAVDLGLGTGNSWVQGDFDLNGVVTTDDYVVVDLNLGKGTANPLAFAEIQAEMIALHTEMFGQSYVDKLAYASEHGWVAASVPEPSVYGTAAFAFTAFFLNRRRRQQRGRSSTSAS